MNRALLTSLAAFALVVGCTTIAGLDGDYSIGDPNLGGAGSGAAGPGPGSGAVGPGSGAGGPGSGAGGPGSGAGGPGAGGNTSGPGSGGNGPGSGGGGMAPIAQVPCSGNPCAVGEVCCVDTSNSQNAQLECAPSGQCPAAANFEASCDGAEDCPGQLCCGTWSGFYWTDMKCQNTCNNADERIMCGGPGAPNYSVCPNNACFGSTAMSGYYYCG